MSDLASVKIWVYGRVQGVFFRTFTARWAQELGITGYVRNLPGGEVEVRAEGARRKLEALISQVNIGPPAARVERVETEWSVYSGDYPDFTVKY